MKWLKKSMPKKRTTKNRIKKNIKLRYMWPNIRTHIYV